MKPGGRFEGDAHGSLTQVMLLYSPKQPEPQLAGSVAVLASIFWNNVPRFTTRAEEYVA